MLVLDLPFTIRSHNLHACDIKRVVGEIISYHMRETSSLPLFGPYGVVHLLTFLWPSLFVSPKMVSTIDLLLNFCFIC